MLSPGRYILEALQQLVSGGDISLHGLAKCLLDPGALTMNERAAWRELSL
jgi:hypothetical protein